MSKSTSHTAETMRKLLSKMTKPQFMGACAKHNVDYVADAPRAPMVNAIINALFPTPVAKTPVVAAAAEVASTDAPASSANVPNLIIQLRAATSPLVKKQLRRKLRAAGHRGGLSTVDESPAV